MEYSESLNHGQLVPAGLTQGSAFSSFLFRPLFELPAIPNTTHRHYCTCSPECLPSLSLHFSRAYSRARGEAEQDKKR